MLEAGREARSSCPRANSSLSCLSGLPGPRNSTQTNHFCPAVRSEHSTSALWLQRLLGSDMVPWLWKASKWNRGTTGPHGLAQGVSLVKQTFRGADVTQSLWLSDPLKQKR